MSCPTRKDIQACLEGGLDGQAAVRVEGHLADCPACRNAFESRRLILQAAVSLEPVPVPDDFAASVMARLEPAEAGLPRLPLGGWLAALAAGIFVFGATLAALALLPGHGLSPAFARLGQGLMESIEQAATVAGKLATLIAVFLRMAGRLAASLIEAVGRAASLAGPGALAAALLTVLIGLAAVAALARRRNPVAEDRHDS
jgi:predicted anti-sigma-YlaC factor YlaD